MLEAVAEVAAPDGRPAGPPASPAPSPGRARRWTVPPHPRALRALRADLRALADEWGVHPDDRDDLLTIVVELVANSIEHTGTTSRVVVRRHDRAVRVVVADGGASDPQLQPQDVTAVRGRGLQMVDRLAGRWGWAVRSRGKLVWATLELHDP